jgi:phage terminase small subunit
MKKAPKPPDSLSESSKRIWRKVTQGWTFDPIRLEILKKGLEAKDLDEVCQKKISELGLLVKIQYGSRKVDGSFNVKANPLLKVQKEARMIFLRAMAQLDLAPQEVSDEKVPNYSE